MNGTESWAQNEFGRAELGDPRRTARAVEIAARAAERPAGTVTAVLKDDAEREGAFRFIRNPRVRVEALARASHRATFERCTTESFVFVAVDQSSLGLTDASGTKDFGMVGTIPNAKIRGLQVMTALAMSESGRVLGVCGQRWWRRPFRKSPPYKKDRRPVTQRESSLWGDVIDDVEDAARTAQSAVRPWYQLDRGADACHVLAKAEAENLLVTVRAAHDRALDGEELRLRAAVAAEKPVATFWHYLSPGAAKRAGHSPMRPRHLEVRTREVTLALTDWTRGGKPGETRTADYYIVHLREKSPPPGAKRLEWFLLTTYPVRCVKDALRVAWGYSLRWRIEEFHKTWKSGACNLERSQLRSSENFKRWATLLAAVAARIERLKQVARTKPTTPALELATRDEIDGAIVLTRRCKWKIGQDITIADFVLLVAQIGGYTGRSSGGPPGTIVIARGLDRVTAAAAALAATRRTKKI